MLTSHRARIVLVSIVTMFGQSNLSPMSVARWTHQGTNDWHSATARNRCEYYKLQVLEKITYCKL